MAIDYSWLEDNVLKRQLAAGEKDKLDGLLAQKDFAKNDNILTQGQPGGVLYILRSGRANISVDSNGQNMHVASAKEGALFGEITFLTGEPATANVIAAGDCAVYKINRADFSELMQTAPELVYVFMASMLVNASKVIRSMDADRASMMQYMGSSHK